MKCTLAVNSQNQCAFQDGPLLGAKMIYVIGLILGQAKGGNMATTRIPGSAATKAGAKTKRQSYITKFTAKIKWVVVQSALWGLLPISFASWLSKEADRHD